MIALIIYGAINLFAIHGLMIHSFEVLAAFYALNFVFYISQVILQVQYLRTLKDKLRLAETTAGNALLMLTKEQVEQVKDNVAAEFCPPNCECGANATN